jgi:hypothetical protein
MWMKIRGTMAVIVLCAASMMAQSGTLAPAPESSKPADHAACMHAKDSEMKGCKKDKDGKMSGEMSCCKKDKDGKMADCCKKGKCAREKKEAEKKS